MAVVVRLLSVRVTATLEVPYNVSLPDEWPFSSANCPVGLFQAEDDILAIQSSGSQAIICRFSSPEKCVKLAIYFTHGHDICIKLKESTVSHRESRSGHNSTIGVSRPA